MTGDVYVFSKTFTLIPGKPTKYV